ncbi:MAG: hypothetical protein QOE45_2586 [Frankiaceae bacterium]|jgi:hypothetical protein|nr:hypothetical protein [Frankiaceae bacterium]
MTTANYTKVPLRSGDRWTGARLQEGQSLLEHEWNLTLDALGRADRDLARDAIGWAGVVAGSTAFQVGVVAGPPRDLTIGGGRMWVDGLEALAPETFRYLSQDQAPPLPTTGTVLVYLEAWPEHVQPAEDPAALVDPALAPIETAARQRVGWRVGFMATTATTCDAAFAALPKPVTDGTLTIDRTAPPAPADPCDPPGDPLGLVPDGLFRVEVIDAGTASTARFAWSYENGGAAVALAGAPAGAVVTLAPSASTKFAAGDKVEVSWLARRADRVAHGALYTVVTPGGGAAGQVLTLDRPVTAPPTAKGLCVRRWDGQVAGATANVNAFVGGADLGVVFRAGAGNFLVGDWWGSRLRGEATETVERRIGVPPDGVRHAWAPLALVNLATPAVVSDCRPSFTPLVDQKPAQGQGVCTVTVFPGDDIQQALDALPKSGGELCIAAGTYVLDRPVFSAGRRRIVVSGVGPATVIRAPRSEAVFVFEDGEEIEVRHLRAESGVAPKAEQHLDAVLTFVACTEVRVVDCDLACPDSEGRAQSCIAVRSSKNADGVGTPPDRVRIEGNRCDVGAWQTGILVTDSLETVVADNVVRFVATSTGRDVTFGGEAFAITELGAMLMRDAAEDKPAFAASREAKAFAAKYAKSNDASTRAAYRAYVTRTRAGKAVNARADLAKLAKTLRVGGQGIVVGGARIGTVRIADNLVDGFVQGVHIGASDAATKGRERAEEVLVTGNVVHALVPPSYNRQRHAVFVGNARSVHVLDTVATLRRSASGVSSIRPTHVDGIVVHGVLGPFLVVRQSSLRGFYTGVRVTPLAPSPGKERRMWLVAETMADGAQVAADAPDCEQERNVR